MNFLVIIVPPSLLILQTELGRRNLYEIFSRQSKKGEDHLRLQKLIIHMVDMKGYILREAENRRIIRLVLIILV